MSQKEKGEHFRALKDAGVEFTKHYRDYTTAELKEMRDQLPGERQPAPPPPPIEDELSPAEAAAFLGQPAPQPADPTGGRMPAKLTQSVPVAPKDESEMPGQRLNQNVELEPLRTDDEGRVWYQEEVLKPAFAKPRGRRVLDYMDTGVETKTVTNGEFVESFEVAGTTQRRPSQVKITLPSYQVGIYKDRRFPWKVHTYNGNQGFDLFEVQNFYGGAELVPTEIKRIYVENVLCYDIRTTIRAVQTEHRQLQLAGKVK
jgi:hypothetical protein